MRHCTARALPFDAKAAAFFASRYAHSPHRRSLSTNQN
jgi:hypothetical protein